MNRSLFGFLAFVIALVIAIGMVWPKAAEVRSEGVEEQARKTLTETYASRIEALQLLEKTFSGNATTVESLVAILPQAPEIPETLVSLEGMAKANSVNLQVLVPQVDKLKQQVTITLSGDGELSSIEGFFNAIADNNRPISITTVSMVKHTDGKRVNITVGLAFPYRDAQAVTKGVN